MYLAMPPATTFTVRLPVELLERLDLQRGDVPRAKYVQRAVEAFMGRIPRSPERELPAQAARPAPSPLTLAGKGQIARPFNPRPKK